MRSLLKVIDKINEWIFNIVAIVLGVTAILTIYQVIARYIMNAPLTWSEEIVKYLMIWVILLGTAIALRKGILISVEVILYVVSLRIKKIMQTIIIIINFLFLTILTVYGFEIIGTVGGQTTGSLELPVSLTYAAIPAGGILGMINCIAVLIELYIGVDKEGDTTDDHPIIH